MDNVREAIVQLLEESEGPSRTFELIMETRRRANVNYITARMVLVDLELEGKLTISDDGLVSLKK